MKKTKAALVLVAMMATLALTACGGSSSTGGSATPVDITLSDDFKINPATVNLVKGGNTLKVKNTGTQTHDFTVKDLNIKVEVPAGQTVTKDFTVSKAGSFKAICTQVGHETSGMTANVEVKA